MPAHMIPMVVRIQRRRNGMTLADTRRIVDAGGSTVKADADARRDSPPEGGRFVYAPMPYWMRLTWRGIGMHAGRIPRPGSPASHGCIRLPREFATQLFQLVRIGTPVRIIR